MNYAAAAAAVQHFIFIEKAPSTMCVHRGGGGRGGGAWTLRRGRSYRFAGHNMFFHFRAFNNPDEAMDTEQTHSHDTYMRFIEMVNERESGQEKGKERERVEGRERERLLRISGITFCCVFRFILSASDAQANRLAYSVDKSH